MKTRLVILICLFFLLTLQPASPGITLALLGDIMLGRGISAVYPQGGWSSALSYLAPQLSKADFSLANLESPITGAPLQPLPSGEIPYDLRAPTAGLQALASAGIDMVSVANNHALDSGIIGLQETYTALSHTGIRTIPCMVSFGAKLAFLAFDDVNKPLDIQSTVRAVSQAHAGGAQVIVSIHWGQEYEPGANARQKQVAQALADAGAALIWGHHPHVLQSVDWVQGRGQPFPTLVAYSLGNTLFDQPAPPDARRSAMLLIHLDSNGVKSFQAVPFVIDVPAARIAAASADEETAILRRLGVNR